MCLALSSTRASPSFLASLLPPALSLCVCVSWDRLSQLVSSPSPPSSVLLSSLRLRSLWVLPSSQTQHAWSTLSGSHSHSHSGHPHVHSFAIHVPVMSVNGGSNGGGAGDPCVRGRVSVVLGAQWGDEGKGKLVDLLAERADLVARCQVRTGGTTAAGRGVFTASLKIQNAFILCPPFCRANIESFLEVSGVLVEAQVLGWHLGRSTCAPLLFREVTTLTLVVDPD